MNIRFWGVRGSIPTPLTPQQVRGKITAVIQRIQQKDLVSSDSRERFIASLPEWIFGTTGGNTPCVEVTTELGTKIICDAGSGIRALGKNGVPPKDLHYHMLFSHFHWDHIQGLPFFDYAYNPKASFDIYSPWENMRTILSNQMVNPYYPVTIDAFSKNFTYHTVDPSQGFPVGEVTCHTVKMAHPGGSYSYAIEENGHKFVYATDVELVSDDFTKSPEKSAVFQDADVLVIDSQYTVEEAFRKQNWGHSAFCYAVDFAALWNIKKLYLFHHEPTYDDQMLHSLCESARWYSSYTNHNDIEINLAIEGQEIVL